MRAEGEAIQDGSAASGLLRRFRLAMTNAVASPKSHPLRAARDRHDAGARDLDQAEGNHEVDEAFDLVGRAGDLEHEALRAGVDDARAECIGEPQGLDAMLALARTLTMASSRSIAGPAIVMSTTRCTGTRRSSWLLICSITIGVPVVTMVMRDRCFWCSVSETVSDLML